MLPAKTPRILWIELTSKCPFDCLFCSRKSRRGAGEHMPYPLFESLVNQVSAPRTFLLNYSGESTVYPHLIPAIRLAWSTGARVELVSALANAPDTLLESLSTAGLTRLTVSVHATDETAFSEIYRHSSFAQLESRLRLFVRVCRESPCPPAIDLAFVAMRRNLHQLPNVAQLAASLGLSSISIFPVIRRDDIPVTFPIELTQSGNHRPEFQAALNACVEESRLSYPEVAFTVCNPQFAVAHPLGESPRPCPGELPAGAAIHSCEQNPFETAHVLANGDVVACEVHDHAPLGNLTRQSLAEIWHGPAYAQFRRDYAAGELAACRSCPWKTACLPGPVHTEIQAERGLSAQMGYGWHTPAGEPHIWSSQQAHVSLQPRPGSRKLLLDGMLPPGPPGQANSIALFCNGAPLGEVENASSGLSAFCQNFPVPDGASTPWQIELQTRFVYRPQERGAGPDQRDLGFALRLLASQPHVDPQSTRRQLNSAGALLSTVRHVDRIGAKLAASVRSRGIHNSRPIDSGIAVVIPERGNLPELSACLAGLESAARRWPEPLQTLIIVNGATAASYADLQSRYPKTRWLFYPRPLGFAGAVAAGLRRVRHSWVYLLNSDVVLEEDALASLAPHRNASIFSIASQIFLKDLTRFREETNLTALLVENGLACAHDLIPKSPQTIEHFYSGGGASLFQTRLLRRFLDPAAYHPFYWEDVEWGWRARKLGYRSLFCAGSVAHHTQRATISEHFSPAHIDAVIERNRLLFQLRNFTTAGSLEAVASAIAAAPPEIAASLTGWRTLGGIARSRLWNYAAPVSDADVLGLSQPAWPSA